MVVEGELFIVHLAWLRIACVRRRATVSRTANQGSRRILCSTPP